MARGLAPVRLRSRRKSRRSDQERFALQREQAPSPQWIVQSQQTYGRPIDIPRYKLDAFFTCHPV